MRFYKAKIILISSFLVVGFLGTPANAAKRECTNAEKALVQNLRQQVVILSNQMTYMKSRRDAANERYKASLGDLSYKVEFDNFNAQVSRADRDMKSKEQQILNVTAKCKYTSSSSSSGSSNLKNCTSSEKKAISSVVQNFQGVQKNKNSWDNKLNVAKSWSQDYSKSSGIRAQAALDTQRYSDLYQEELAVEAFIVEQFNLLNSSCKNSGIALPKPYLTLDQRINNVNKESGAQIIQVSDESRDFSGGPFYITENDDSSFTVNCTKPTWQGINLNNMSLFLVGSTAANPLYAEVFMKSNSPSKWIFSPLIKLQATSKIGNNIGTQNFNGKFITSNSTSACGLVTEKLGDLTKNFASDVKSVGLLLKPNEQLNPTLFNSGYYTYLGGVLLNSLKDQIPVKTFTVRAKSYANGFPDRYMVFCGVLDTAYFDWKGGLSKVRLLDEVDTLLNERIGLFAVRANWINSKTETWMWGTAFSLNDIDEETFKKKKFNCEFNLVGDLKYKQNISVPSELQRVGYPL